MQRGRDVTWDNVGQCGMYGVTWDTTWDELYGENGIYKGTGNPSCLVFGS